MDTIALGIIQHCTDPNFHGLLQTVHSGSLESKLGLEYMGALSDESLEGKTTGEALSALLVTTDLSQGNSPGLKSVGLLQCFDIFRMFLNLLRRIYFCSSLNALLSFIFLSWSNCSFSLIKFFCFSL